MLIYLDILCGYVCQLYIFVDDSKVLEMAVFMLLFCKPYEEGIKLHLANLAGRVTPEHRTVEQSGRYVYMLALLREFAIYYDIVAKITP